MSAYYVLCVKEGVHKILHLKILHSVRKMKAKALREVTW